MKKETEPRMMNPPTHPPYPLNRLVADTGKNAQVWTFGHPSSHITLPAWNPHWTKGRQIHLRLIPLDQNNPMIEQFYLEAVTLQGSLNPFLNLPNPYF